MIYAGRDSEHGKPVADTPDKVDDPALVTRDPAGDSEEADEEEIVALCNPLNPLAPDCALPSM